MRERGEERDTDSGTVPHGCPSHLSHLTVIRNIHTAEYLNYNWLYLDSLLLSDTNRTYQIHHILQTRLLHSQILGQPVNFKNQMVTFALQEHIIQLFL